MMKRWFGGGPQTDAEVTLLFKQDLIDINGFDESFQGWGHEDADLVIRLIKKGVKRRSGKYASVVFHQWHKINDRVNEKSNKAALMKSIHSANLKTNNGLEKIQRIKDEPCRITNSI